jgi:DNA polymerase-3 subunit epsilon
MAGTLREFTALDVETANPNLASICQIGLVSFRDGRIVERWESLVNPEDYFDPLYVWRSGIDETTVRTAPTFRAIHVALGRRINGRLIASHMPFDRLALVRDCERYGMPQFEYTWLDTARVVRRAWPQFAARGYNLVNIATECEIEFDHHNALEDARAAGEVLLRAIERTGISLSDWLLRAQQPISAAVSVSFAQDGNPDGPLYGESIAFTGALTLGRKEAARLAAICGCAVTDGVTQATTLLVVGDQDIRRLAGHEKSAKHRKAEALIAKGQTIRILQESDFQQLVKQDA